MLRVARVVATGAHGAAVSLHQQGPSRQVRDACRALGVHHCANHYSHP